MSVVSSSLVVPKTAIVGVCYRCKRDLANHKHTNWCPEKRIFAHKIQTEKDAKIFSAFKNSDSLERKIAMKADDDLLDALSAEFSKLFDGQDVKTDFFKDLQFSRQEATRAHQELTQKFQNLAFLNVQQHNAKTNLEKATQKVQELKAALKEAFDKETKAILEHEKIQDSCQTCRNGS